MRPSRRFPLSSLVPREPGRDWGAAEGCVGRGDTQHRPGSCAAVAPLSTPGQIFDLPCCSRPLTPFATTRHPSQAAASYQAANEDESGYTTGESTSTAASEDGPGGASKKGKVARMRAQQVQKLQKKAEELEQWRGYVGWE